MNYSRCYPGNPPSMMANRTYPQTPIQYFDCSFGSLPGFSNGGVSNANRHHPHHHANNGLYLSNSNPTIMAAVPLPHSCFMCNQDFIENLSHSTVQVPVQVNLRTEMLAPPPVGGRRDPLENELMAVSPSPYQYLPPQAPLQHESKSKRRKMEADVDRLKAPGPPQSQRYWKWLMNRSAAKTESKNKTQRFQKPLKRLINKSCRCIRKMEVRNNFEEQQSIRDAKWETLRRRGIKAPRKTECPLYNCARKQYQHKWQRLYMTKSPGPRSASRLSDLSKKSRSPIVFGRSP